MLELRKDSIPEFSIGYDFGIGIGYKTENGFTSEETIDISDTTEVLHLLYEGVFIDRKYIGAHFNTLLLMPEIKKFTFEVGIGFSIYQTMDSYIHHSHTEFYQETTYGPNNQREVEYSQVENADYYHREKIENTTFWNAYMPMKLKYRLSKKEKLWLLAMYNVGGEFSYSPSLGVFGSQRKIFQGGILFKI